MGGGGVTLWGPRFCNTCATHISVPLPQPRRIRQRMRLIRPRSPPVGDPSLDLQHLQHMQYPQYLQYLPLRPSTRQVACLFTMCVCVCVCVCVCMCVFVCTRPLSNCRPGLAKFIHTCRERERQTDRQTERQTPASEQVKTWTSAV